MIRRHDCTHCGASFGLVGQRTTDADEIEFACKVKHHQDRKCSPSAPPTYEPKPGDTVMLTLKPAEVEWVNADQIGLLMWPIISRKSLASIEKVPDPLPTTPGSVITGNLTQRRYFRTEREWVCDSGSRHPFADLGTSMARFTVLFDAGKATS